MKCYWFYLSYKVAFSQRYQFMLCAAHSQGCQASSATQLRLPRIPRFFCRYPLFCRISFARLNRIKTAARELLRTWRERRGWAIFFNQTMWVLANRDGALRAAHRRAAPPESILISVRDLGWECALIFRLKTLRRVARAAVEMHLMGGGAGVALEGRRPVITGVKCFVPSPSPLLSCVCMCGCACAIDQVRFMTYPDRHG
jgi:hypothetical protein